MKTLRTLLLAAALTYGCQDDFNKNEAPKEETCEESDLKSLNDEASLALEEYTGVSDCVNLVYSPLASKKYGLVLESGGPIYLDQNFVESPLSDDVMFSIIAHEYGHVFYRDPYYQPYIEYLTSDNICADISSIDDLEGKADYFSGVLTAVAGRPAEPLIDFIESISDPESFWGNPCVQQVYSNDERVENFSAGYQEALDRGF